MTGPTEEEDQFRGVRRLFKWIAIVTVLCVCLLVFAFAYMMGSFHDSDEEAEESARPAVVGLASVLDYSMSDKAITAAVRRHHGYYPHIVRKPGKTTLFARFEGYASGIPYGGRRLVCFRLVIFEKPRATVFEHQEMCPPAAPSSTLPPPS